MIPLRLDRDSTAGRVGCQDSFEDILCLTIWFRCAMILSLPEERAESLEMKVCSFSDLWFFDNRWTRGRRAALGRGSPSFPSWCYQPPKRGQTAVMRVASSLSRW